MHTNHTPILLFDGAPTRARSIASQLREQGLPTVCVDLTQPAPLPAVENSDVALFVLDREQVAHYERNVDEILDTLSSKRVASLVWGLDTSDSADKPLVEHAPPTAPIAEILGRLATLTHFAPMVRRLDVELDHLQRLGNQFNRYINEIDHEMRLAGRLQRDFLPRELPEHPPLRFAALYRPATWVSGDLYDVFAIDPAHVGIFVADAMGHGTAAALMTMMLRQSLCTLRAQNGSKQIIAPRAALLELHNRIAEQRLPTHQFVTATYALVDTATLQLTLARGGHPYAIRIKTDGTLEELQPCGGLIGIPDLEPEFEEQTVALRHGEKVVFYTDGVEDVLIEDRDTLTSRPTYTALLHQCAQRDAQALIDKVSMHLDTREGSLHPEDDITMVVLEVLPQPSAKRKHR